MLVEGPETDHHRPLYFDPSATSYFDLTRGYTDEPSASLCRMSKCAVSNRATSGDVRPRGVVPICSSIFRVMINLPLHAKELPQDGRFMFTTPKSPIQLVSQTYFLRRVLLEARKTICGLGYFALSKSVYDGWG